MKIGKCLLAAVALLCITAAQSYAANTFGNDVIGGPFNIGISNLGGITGSPSSSNFLRGDGTWAASGGSGTVSTGTSGQAAYYTANGTSVGSTPYLVIGTASAPVTMTAPANIGAPNFLDTTGTTALQATGNINNFYQVLIQNTNAGSSASADIVIGGNDMTATTHYFDCGKNGSAGGTTPFANADASYCYTIDNELDLGAQAATGVINLAVGATPTTEISIGSTAITISEPIIGTATWTAAAIDATHGGTAQTSWTQGDTLYASAANALSKLAAGTYGTLLTTGGTSGTPSWNEAASMAYNFVFNPRMFIAQRNGTNSVSLTNDGTIFHVADQYDVVVSTNQLSGCTAQIVVDGPSADLPLSLKLTCTTGGTPASAGYAIIVPWYEGSNWSQLGFGTSGAQPISESCWVKANYTGSIGFGLVANSNDSRGYTPTHSSVTSGVWTRLKVENIPGDTTGTWQSTDGTLGAFAPHITPVAGSGVCTASTNQWASSAGLCETGNQVSTVANNFTFQVTGCQIEKGAIAPPLPISDYATDFNRAQRFVQCVAETTGPFCNGAATSTTAFGCMWQHRVKMDKVPTLDTVTTISDLSVYTYANANVATVTALSMGTASRDASLLTGTTAGSMTSNVPYQIRNTTALSGNVCLEANP